MTFKKQETQQLALTAVMKT